MTDIFRGTTALITGASLGLGEQFARQLAARGCHLVIVARSEKKLRALATELSERHGVRVVPIALDLSLPAEIDELCRRVDELGVQIDHLVSNAGAGSSGAFAGSDAERQRAILRLNVEAPLVLARHLLPGMIARDAGGVLNVASAVAFYPVPFMATYGASKAFVLSHSCAIAEEVATTAVRVTALCPGPVATGFQANAGYTMGRLERLAELSAQATVASGIRAYERGKRVQIPGALNTLQAFLPRFASLRFVSSTVASVMKRLGRA
jgi:short-subunit dehydrogenase